MGQVHVPEDVSVKKVKEFYTGLRDAMKDGDELVLDFGAVSRVDLAVMQVLIALSRACRHEKITLKIKGASGELKNQMRICGMIK